MSTDYSRISQIPCFPWKYLCAVSGMKAIELKQKPKEELQELLQEKRKRLEELRFLSSQGKVKNVKEILGVKKDIARILTLLRV